MIIAKQNISSLSQKFKTGDQVVGLSVDEEKRLIKLGAVQYIDDLNVKNKEDERKEVTWFKAVMEDTTVKEKFEYAKKAEIEVGKSKTNKGLMDILVNDAVENGVDVQAFSETQLFSFAEKMGIATADKDSDTIIAEVEAGFENV